MQSDLHHAICCSCRIDHCSAFGDRVPDRLLDVNVRTRLNRSNRDQRMPVIGRRHNNDFGSFLVEKFPEVAILAPVHPRSLSARGQRPDPIGDGRHHTWRRLRTASIVLLRREYSCPTSRCRSGLFGISCPTSVPRRVLSESSMRLRRPTMTSRMCDDEPTSKPPLCKRNECDSRIQLTSCSDACSFRMLRMAMRLAKQVPVGWTIGTRE